MKTTLYMIRSKPNSLWKVTLDPDEAERAKEAIWTDLEPAQLRKLAGALLGSLSSPAKASAARENGKKGGRPRKDAIAHTHPKSGKAQAEPGLFGDLE